ncbi:MAG: hypothetical protein ACOCUY_00695 [Verrucomicrobiota bacterium]
MDKLLLSCLVLVVGMGGAAAQVPQRENNEEKGAPVTTPPRIAVVSKSDAPNAAAAKVRALVEATLSDTPEVQVVSRKEIDQIFEELSRQELFSAHSGPNNTELWNALSGADLFVLLEAADIDSDDVKVLRVRFVDAHHGIKHADLSLHLSEHKKHLDSLVELLSAKAGKHALSESEDGKNRPLLGVLPLRSLNVGDQWAYVGDVLTSALEHRLCSLKSVRVLEHSQAGILSDERQLTDALPDAIAAAAVVVDGEFEVRDKGKRAILHIHVRARRLDGPEVLRFEFELNELADIPAKIESRLLETLFPDRKKPADTRYDAETEARLLLRAARLHPDQSRANRLAESALAIAPNQPPVLFDFLDFAYALEGAKVRNDKALERRARDAFFRLMSQNPSTNKMSAEQAKILFACADSVHPYQPPLVDPLVGMPYLGINRYVLEAVGKGSQIHKRLRSFRQRTKKSWLVHQVLNRPSRWHRDPHHMVRLFSHVVRRYDSKYLQKAGRAWGYFCSADQTPYEGDEYENARETGLTFFRSLTDSESNPKKLLGGYALLKASQHDPAATLADKREAFEAYARMYTENEMWKDEMLCTLRWLAPFDNVAETLYGQDKRNSLIIADFLRTISRGILDEQYWLESGAKKVLLMARTVAVLHRAGQDKQARNLAEDVIEAVMQRSGSSRPMHLSWLRRNWKDIDWGDRAGDPFDRVIGEDLDTITAEDSGIMLRPGGDNDLQSRPIFSEGGLNIAETDQGLVIVQSGGIVRLDPETFQVVERQKLPYGKTVLRTGHIMTEKETVCVQITDGIAVFQPGRKPEFYSLAKNGLADRRIVGYDILHGNVYIILSGESTRYGATLISWNLQTDVYNTILSVHKDADTVPSLQNIDTIHTVVADRFHDRLLITVSQRNGNAVRLEYQLKHETFNTVAKDAGGYVFRMESLVCRRNNKYDLTFTDLKTGIEQSRVRAWKYGHYLPKYVQTRRASSSFSNLHLVFPAGRGVLNARPIPPVFGKIGADLNHSAVLFYTPPTSIQDSKKLFDKTSGNLSKRALGRNVVILNRLLFDGLETPPGRIESLHLSERGLLILTDARLLLSPGMAQFNESRQEFSQGEIEHACRLYATVGGDFADKLQMKQILRRHFGYEAVDWFEKHTPELNGEIEQLGPEFWNKPRSELAMFQEGRLLWLIGEEFTKKRRKLRVDSTKPHTIEKSRSLKKHVQNVYGLVYKYYKKSPWYDNTGPRRLYTAGYNLWRQENFTEAGKSCSNWLTSSRTTGHSSRGEPSKA